MKFHILRCVFLVGLLTVTEVAFAAAGDPDLSFNGTGTQTLGFGGGDDRARAGITQPDGKLLLAGASGYFSENTFSLVRLGTNNIPDPTFGNSGTVVTPVGAQGLPFSIAQINAIRLQTDGRIVVAGSAYTGTNQSAFTLVRYHTNGALDTTFGTNGTGIVYTDFPFGAVIRAMSLQGDGKIVVAGYTVYAGGNAGQRAVALARYQTNGTLDTSFGAGGTQITTGVDGYTGAHAMLIQSDGKILAVGIGIGPGHNGTDFALYRYTTNGVLDPAFGGGTGKVYTQIHTNASNHADSAEAVAIQFGNFTVQNPDKIVVAGTYRNFNIPGHQVVALTRYHMDGTLDATFGNNGIVTNILTGLETPVGLVVQGQLNQPRRIIVGGYGFPTGSNYVFLSRYTASGAFDTTFGGQGTGRNIVSFPTALDLDAHALVLNGGRFLVVGNLERPSGDLDFSAVGFNGDGTLDTNYGAGGVVTADIADRESSAQAVAIQADGKVLVVGRAEGGSPSLAIARFNPDGSLDPTFGVNGRVKGLLNGSGEAKAVLTQPDGKVVIAGAAYGSTGSDMALLRLLPDGTLDPSFGSNGVVTTSFFSADEIANAVILQPDGKLLVTGSADVGGGNQDIAVARYHANGALDNSFDGDGKVTTAVGPAGDQASAIRLQSDGKIVVAGVSYINGQPDFALVRYQSNGALDNSFGSFGRVATDIASGSLDVALGMTLGPGGKIIAAGYSQTVGGIDVAVARYNSNGTPDLTFDGDGKLTTQIGLTTDFGTAVALQPDGKIVVGGAAQIGSFTEFAAVRYQTNGLLDDSFGFGGKAVLTFGNNTNNLSLAMAIDERGRLVLVGEAARRFGIARMLGDPFLRIESITRAASQTALTGIGVPNSTHTVLSSATLNPGSFSSVGTANADATGMWLFQHNSTTSNRFYRLSFP